MITFIWGFLAGGIVVFILDWLFFVRFRNEICEKTDRKYKKAFKIACKLLNGDFLYGYDDVIIFEELMKKDGFVSSRTWEDFILNNLKRLSGMESEE